mmetsp:Transcript_114954/g.371641  ORF Transcript_114954/g.371641 Transcript_114954/m.371641 type:complete len:319 (-) Transcript_114954:20-976(-)
MRCGGLPCGPLRRVRCRPLCVPSLLAGCVTLGIAMRVMVQQRVYYGLLKAGGLLDFQNVEGWRDPLLLVLVFSMVHAIGHFTLKLHALVLSGVAVHEELQQVAINFIAPYVVFMAFLYGSNDIEKMLVLLNKFVEEDPEHARKALASMVHLDEDVVRTDVLSRDVVGDALEDAPSIEAVYREVIRGYPEAKAGMPPQEDGFIQFHLQESLWPARMLLDARLSDEKTSSFRLMFHIFLTFCLLVQVTVFCLFFQQAVLKDLYHDAYLQGHTVDVLGAIVLLAHAALVVWIMHVTLWPVMASAAEVQVKKLKAATSPKTS